MKSCWEHNNKLAPSAEYWIDKRKIANSQVWKAHLFTHLKLVKFCEISFWQSFVNATVTLWRGQSSGTKHELFEAIMAIATVTLSGHTG